MYSQNEMRHSIETIKAEVTPNGGSSIKDVIIKLNQTCNRVENRQKIIDQRSKAALHYQKECLFETDNKGNMLWANEAFYQETVDMGDISDGLDWVSIVDEDYREDFLKEFESCLQMGRRLDVESTSMDGRNIHFVGYPYRLDLKSHEGFLIHLKILETENGISKI